MRLEVGVLTNLKRQRFQSPRISTLQPNVVVVVDDASHRVIVTTTTLIARDDAWK